MTTTIADPASVHGLRKPGRTTRALIGPHPFPEVSGGEVGRDEVQVFMVDVEPTSPPIGTHFHPVDQYQLFLRGDGYLGRHPVTRGCVHYADANTPYGPLRAGPSGFAYLVFRCVSDAGAYWMPADRDELAARLGRGHRAPSSRRNLSVDVDPHDAAQLKVDSELKLIVNDPDGLRIAVVGLAPSADWAPPPVAGAAALMLVLGGGIGVGNTMLGPDTFVVARQGEKVPSHIAGLQGATLLLVELPHPAATA